MMKCNQCGKLVTKTKFGICCRCFKHGGWKYNKNVAFKKCVECQENWVRISKKPRICLDCIDQMMKPIVQMDAEQNQEDEK